MNKQLLTAMAVLALSAAGSAQAMDMTLVPFVGASMGQSKVSDPFKNFTGNVDDKDTAWKLFGGMEVTKNIAVELGYVNLGESSATAIKSKTAGASMHVVGMLPIGASFAVFGKGGFAILHTEIDSTNNALDVNDTDLEWGLGLGASYNITKSVAVRAEWERYFNVGDATTTGESDIDLMSLGLVIKF